MRKRPRPRETWWPWRTRCCARSLRVAQANSARRLSADESQLFEEINRGPSTAEMERDLELIRKRQEARLAELRGVEVEMLMQQLQLDPPAAL